MAARVMVVGSSNMDLVIRAGRIPRVGETILGDQFRMIPGGKGANQAVAAARLGAEVFLVTRLGGDLYGKELRAQFAAFGIRDKYILQTDEVSTGVAGIFVDQQGCNVIVVVPGANHKLTPEDVGQAASDIRAAGAVVAQLEVPLETVQYAAETAYQYKVPFILNPAPAQPLGKGLLEKTAIITPNETEAEILTDIRVEDQDSAFSAAARLREMGVESVIITMGQKGYAVATPKEKLFCPAIAVAAVDTTAAGDAFTGSLAWGIAGGRSITEAARFANYVAALSVTREGAQPSMPAYEEVAAFIKTCESK
ncbi:MAG: Ribokinase [Planctomycetes bacterium ADurb.Bin412]|nr:MAG: Ribokinase [Planctomycetes bacterium ADurb.Bin412]